MKKLPFKLFIVLFPSFMIGFFSFSRAQFFGHYLTAEQGAMLAPLLLLITSILFIWPLFRDMDRMEQALVRAARREALFAERKAMAANLHDSIAQSLFLMSVKLDGIHVDDEAQQQKVVALKALLGEVHGEVRQAIRDFSTGEMVGRESITIQQQIADFKHETGISVTYTNYVEELEWSSGSQVVLVAFVNEGLYNIRKHAKATKVNLTLEIVENRCVVCLRDDGQLFNAQYVRGFGLRLLEERLSEKQWTLTFERIENWTVLKMEKEVRHGHI